MSRDPKAHPSDHSGAHKHGTSYHEKHAHTTANAHSGDEAEDHELQMQEKPQVPAPDKGVDNNEGGADTSDSMPGDGEMTGDGATS